MCILMVRFQSLSDQPATVYCSDRSNRTVFFYNTLKKYVVSRKKKESNTIE